MVLALSYAGAGGNTAAELRKTLSLPESKEDLITSVQSLFNIFQTDQVILKTANGLFANPDYEFNPEYIKSAQKNFLADVRTIDFGNEEVARQEINTFVERHTNDKITDLFPQGN